jgi:hypothetical protein
MALNFSMIILTPNPPSNNTSLTRFFPIYLCIMAIWWSIEVITRTCNSFETNVFMDWNLWINYHLSFGVILMRWPKFKVYFVSRTCWLISYKINSTDWIVDGIGIEGSIDIGKDNGTNGGTNVVVRNLGQLVSKFVGWFFGLVIYAFCTSILSRICTIWT